MRTIATVATAFSLAVTISACSPGDGAPRPRQSTSIPPSANTHGPFNAKLEPTGLVSQLPNTCQTVSRSLPAEMASASALNSFTGSVRDSEECEWISLSDMNARIFRYGLWKYDSSAKARKELDLEAHRTDFRDYDCHYKATDVKKIANIGEEAFATPCTYKKYDSFGHPESSHVYQIAGVNLIFRTRNVAIRLWWAKADYPASVTRNNPHWLQGGKQLMYSQALPQAIQVARAILTHFPQ